METKWIGRNKMKKFKIVFGIFIAIIVPMAAISVHHNWYLTTPERFLDPFNWYMMIAYLVILGVFRYIAKRIE